MDVADEFGKSNELACIAGEMLGEGKSWANKQQSREGNGEKARI